MAIKDQIHTKGIRTTDGSRIRAEFIPDADATVFSRLENAGAVLLGKLNMSEFAFGDPGSSLIGPARNPWDLQRSPGVSSSGSGAATAAFLCATSLGEDTGGSIRGPAANCGLVGLRPTWGRVSRYGVDGASWSIDTIGPLSRTVSDCAITLEVIAGYDSNDPLTSRLGAPDLQAHLTGDIRGLRVGLVQELLDPERSGVTQVTRDGVLAAAKVLSSLGAEVKEVSIPMAPQSGAIIRTITSTERVSLHPEWLRERPQEYNHGTRVGFLTGNIIPAQTYYKALKLRAMVRRQVMEALEQADVLLQPTSGGPAALMNPGQKVESKEQATRALLEGSFRGVYSLAGTPALSIVCGFTSDQVGGLPLAMQIAGRPFDEATVLRVAHAYEQGTQWHTRIPPI